MTAVLSEITRINLCCYSMGGRLALSFACEDTQMVNRLILESTTAGIIDEVECEKRISEDLLNLAEINKDYSGFIKKWSENLLFENQKKKEFKWLGSTTRNPFRTKWSSTLIIITVFRYWKDAITLG